jgi:hypothetical protein
MNDNAVMAAIISTATAGLAAQNIIVGIKQNYQPTVQGAPSLPTILIHKISDNRYGWPYRSDVFASGVETHTETEWIETEFQASCIATQDPSNTTQLTSADYLKALARWLQSYMGIAELLAAGLGIYRIEKMSQRYWLNDRRQYQTEPTFEFTVTHQDVLVQVVPSTAKIVPNITTILE